MVRVRGRFHISNRAKKTTSIFPPIKHIITDSLWWGSNKNLRWCPGMFSSICSLTSRLLNCSFNIRPHASSNWLIHHNEHWLCLVVVRLRVVIECSSIETSRDAAWCCATAGCSQVMDCQSAAKCWFEVRRIQSDGAESNDYMRAWWMCFEIFWMG